MSIEMLNWAFHLQMDSPTDKLVLIALADHANHDGASWPSIARLCLFTALSERTVRAALRRLEAAGILHTEQTNGRTNRYWLTPAADTPGESYPPPRQEMPPTPAATAPKPPITTNEPPSPLTKRRSHRLPLDWQPEPHDRDWARQAYPTVEVDDETDRFRDYWHGNGKSMVDWRATWRNWIRRSASYQRTKGKSFDQGARRTDDNRERLRAALDGTTT